MKSNIFTKIAYIIISILVLFIAVSVFIHTLPYYSYTIVGFLTLKEYIRDLIWWKIAFYMHISVGVIILLSGLAQFSKKIRKESLEFHRNLGKIYVLAVLFLSAPGGFIMAFYAESGILAQIAFVILAILWFYYTYMAYRYIKVKNIQEHENYMIRSYALTLAAVFLRLYIAIGIMAFGIRNDLSYIVISYISWIPNLAIAEIYIYFKNRKIQSSNS